MNSNTSKLDISPKELKALIDQQKVPFLLDIREAQEIQICALPGHKHIPMSELAHRLNELDSLKEQEIVVYCRSGARSDRCAVFLRQQGFKHVQNLTGGILAWADDVDPNLTKY